MKHLLLILISLICMLPCKSQNYTRDAGFRFGGLTSINYRQYNNDTEAFGLMASLTWRSIRLGAMKEYFKPAMMQFSNNINFVYGYGAHVGLIYANSYKLFFKTYHLDEWQLSPLFGIDGLIGLEYNLGDLPVLIGIDFKPFFEFSTTRIFYIFLNDASISLKYKF